MYLYLIKTTCSTLLQKSRRWISEIVMLRWWKIETYQHFWKVSNIQSMTPFLGASRKFLCNLWIQIVKKVYAVTHLVFFPFNLDFIVATSIPAGRGGVFRESTTDILSTFVIDGGILGRSSVWREEPGSIDDDTVSMAIFSPFETEGRSSSSASVSLEPPTFSGDMLNEWSGEWRERNHLSNPLCTPKSPKSRSVSSVTQVHPVISQRQTNWKNVRTSQRKYCEHIDWSSW